MLVPCKESQDCLRLNYLSQVMCSNASIKLFQFAFTKCLFFKLIICIQLMIQIKVEQVLTIFIQLMIQIKVEQVFHFNEYHFVGMCCTVEFNSQSRVILYLQIKKIFYTR